MDEGQLPIALKNPTPILIDVAESSKCQRQGQKRSLGRFVKEKPVSTKRHPGLPRRCPQCNKELKSKKAFFYHLQSKRACPIGLQGKCLEELYEQAVKNSKLVVIKSSDELVGNVTVDNECCTLSSNRPNQPVSKYFKEFQDSFSNPIYGSSNRKKATIEKIVSAVRRVINLCNYEDISDMFSKQGIDELSKVFKRPVTFSTHKGICQGYLEFIKYLEVCDDLKIDPSRRDILKATLRNAYDSFCRGTSNDNSDRRVKLSHSIRNGDLPTFSEITQVYKALEKKVPHLIVIIIQFVNVFFV